MNISYQGIGQWCATFACEGVGEGSPVKVSADAAVAECADGEEFCGVVLAAAGDGEACTVQLGGLVALPYSGESTPALGYCALAADGAGGVKTAEGAKSRLVVERDTAAKTVTIML